MSEAIRVLVDLASNATLDTQENITTMLAEADISLEQEQAIIDKDEHKLAESIYDLPKIEMIFPILPAEDDEPDNDNQEEEDNNTDTNAVSAIAINN